MVNGRLRLPGPLPRRRSELGLLCVGGLLVLAATMLESLGVTNALPDHAVGFVVGLVIVIFFVQVINRRYAPEADAVILPVALVLNGLGYVMIERVAPSEAGQQVAWTAVGLFLYAMVLATVTRSRDLERYRYILVFLAFLLLVAPIIPHFGESIGGERLWVRVPGGTFQPVEIAKLFLVIFFASYFIEKRELLTIPTRRVGDHLLPDLRAFGPIAVAGVMSLLIILAEHDIGFSLILFVMFLSMLWVTTGRWTYPVLGLVLFVLGTFVASHILGQVNQRIEIWMDPWRYYYANEHGGIGYQAAQGEMAFGRGGLFGTGLGTGLSAGYVPVADSDYIFSVIGEEWGLIGTAGFVAAFLLIVGCGFRAAIRACSEFARLVAVGLTVVIGFQAFFIMGGVARLLPLTGVTMPFVSYGGSSLVANYVLIALLVRISDEGNQKDPLPAPMSSRTAGAAVIGAGSG